MNSLFDKLNLRPQERRLVVGVGIVVFVVLNVWLVFPRFGDYGRFQLRIQEAERTVNKYETEIKKEPAYRKDLADLQGQGVYVPSEDAARRLYEEVNSQANLTGLGYSQISPATRGSTTRSNAYFDETSVTVQIRTGEKELIEFLHRLTDKELMIRAKTLIVGPDQPGRMLLQGSVTLVKSFQRKPPAKAPAGGPRTSAPAQPAATSAGPKPAVTPAVKPAKPPATAPAPSTSKPGKKT